MMSVRKWKANHWFLVFEGPALSFPIEQRLLLWGVLVLLSAGYCLNLRFEQTRVVSASHMDGMTFAQLKQRQEELLLKKAQWTAQAALAKQAKQLGMAGVSWQMTRRVPSS